MNNLPPVLPTSSGSSKSNSPLTSIKRNAGDVSIGQTQQKKDVAAANVSMHQAMQKKVGNAPTTSVYRIGQDADNISTSISRPADARRSIYQEEGQEEAARDYRRFSYIRRKIKERKAAQARVEKEIQKSSGGIQAGIGSGYRKTGVTSFRRRMENMFRKNRATYKNLSAKDKKMFEDIVEGHLSKKATGKAINRLDRRKMGLEVYKNWKSGKITKTDYQDMKRIIRDLE